MIELTRVEKRYERGASAFYTDQLTLGPGEIIGVLGDNGSGKTSLLKAIMGLGERSNGTVTVDGKPVQEQYARMAYITEEGSWLPGMSPAEYAEFLAGFYPRFDLEYYERLLKFFQLEPDRRIRSLSKGQRAKLDLAAGFAKQADYLIMDEPFFGMDRPTRTGFLSLMAAELTGEETLLVATHFVEDFANLFDRVLLLNGGRIRVDASVDALRQQGRTVEELMAEVSLGKWNKTFI